MRSCRVGCEMRNGFMGEVASAGHPLLPVHDHLALAFIRITYCTVSSWTFWSKDVLDIIFGFSTVQVGRYTWVIGF